MQIFIPYRWPLFLVILITIAASCSKMDDYKKYTPTGEISYTGKADSLKIYSGHNRVLVTALFISDPKIVSCRIYWDSRSDSVTVPVSRTEGVDTLRQFITGISEGAHTFELVTMDALGNRSVVVYGTGTVYGDRLQSSLLNRAIISSQLNADLNTEVSFAGLDLTSGVFATDISYTNTSGGTSTLRVPIATSDTALPNHKYGSSFDYRTLYLPDTLSIDTFYTAYASYQPVSGAAWIDLTSKYIANPGAPFTYSTWDGSRWGILAGWTESADVKNTSSGNGGYELRGGVGVLSMEGGWGLPGVANGKIYQGVNLPYGGQWRLEATISDNGSVGTKYLAAATGSDMPDYANITSSALAYYNFSSASAGTINIQFTIANPSLVYLGFVATIPNTGAYFKVTSVKLKYLKE